MSNGAGDADEIELVYLSDLATAQPGSDTDTFAICQQASGCSSGEPLVQMSLAQLKAYLGVSAAPAFTGPDILGVILGVNCDGTSGYNGASGGHAFRKYAFGQNCVITAVYACNPSVPLSGVGFTLTSNSGEPIASGTIDLPNVLDATNGIGGSIQLFASADSANMADQYFLEMTSPLGPAGSLCDVYILGFPMQPLQ